MTVAKLTLIGLNNYTDGHLWDGLSCPNGIDKTTFINTIMLNYGEMETLYADPDMMKFAIKTWSDRNSWSMLKAVTAINVQYEPLNNYDRHETRSTEGSSSGSNTGTVTDAGSHSRSTGSTTTTESSAESSTSATIDRDETNETEHKVSAYDSSTYSPDNTDDGSSTYDEESTSSGTSEAESTSTTQGTDTGTEGNTRTDNLRHADEHEETETIRAWGNIGLTTSQQMLQSELYLSLYNLYSTFAGLFAYDLLIMTY